jgi:hypothetical protein
LAKLCNYYFLGKVLCQGICLLMEGGATRNRRAMPPIEKPMSCVDITSIQSSIYHQYSNSRNELTPKWLTCKAPDLFVVNTLDGDDICCVSALRAHARHDCHQNLIKCHVNDIPRFEDAQYGSHPEGVLTCSLIVKGPGFKSKPNIDQCGHIRTHARPTGNTRSWATSCVYKAM